MTLNTFTSGVNTSFSTELNQNFAGGKVALVYSGAGFDISTTASGTTSTSYELSEIAASDIGSADYAKISVLVATTLRNTPSLSSTAALQIEIKEIGGSYSSIFNENVYGNNYGYQMNTTTPITFYHTLTSGEKTNGFQVKLTSSVVRSAVSSGDTNTFTNKQTVINLVN